jgi:hypothetical protein
MTDRLIFLQQETAGIWFYPPSPGGTHADQARRAAFGPLPLWELDAAGFDADAGNQADCDDLTRMDEDVREPWTVHPTHRMKQRRYEWGTDSS